MADSEWAKGAVAAMLQRVLALTRLEYLRRASELAAK